MTLCGTRAIADQFVCKESRQTTQSSEQKQDRVLEGSRLQVVHQVNQFKRESAARNSIWVFLSLPLHADCCTLMPSSN